MEEERLGQSEVRLHACFEFGDIGEMLQFPFTFSAVSTWPACGAR